MTHSTTRPANRLASATSPYLLQHAHNPVDWYEWGPEALDRARRENKPIFLSIGYSACHWCHVMERESFENDDIAAVMNQHFVCIKVDREERPDLDDLYMTATQALTGSGGWPMSVWLAPDGRPFYAGTYFPPEDHYGRPGFKRVLEFLAQAWEKDHDKCLEQAAALTAAIEKHTRVDPGTELVPFRVVADAAARLAGAFDRRMGGLSGGGTNKFPPSMAMDLMLRVNHFERSLAASTQPAAQGQRGSLPYPEATTKPNRDLLDAVTLTLDKMAAGGIYDHLGGGIARYSTDVDWLVPHFEKMLYDQALVSNIYLDAYRVTGKPHYARVAREIFDYVIADLQSPEGGFYSTRDADSEGHEGKFYVWSRAEVDAVLGNESALFCDYYDVDEKGNWEGTSILNTPGTIESLATKHGITVDAAESRLAVSRKRLFDVREKRVKPHLDDKVLSAWNGLMIASMAKGYRVLDDVRYRDAAQRAADFVMTHMVVDGRLQRTYRQGKTHTPAFLEDHAFMIDGLITLYETTFEWKRLEQAAMLNDYVMSHFRDVDHGGFFFTSDVGEQPLFRAKEANDSAIPSGNSVQLMNLLRLSVLLDRKDFSAEADRAIRVFSRNLVENPFRSERMLSAIDFHHRRPREIAFVAESTDDPAFNQLVHAAWRTYVPNAVYAAAFSKIGGAAGAGVQVPLLADKSLVGGKATAHVCRNFACQKPTGDALELVRQLSN